MIYKRIKLNKIDEQASKDSSIELFLYKNKNLPFKKRPGILIVPGGGYTYIAPLEAENVAHRFAAEGFNCFILNYATNKIYPAPHIDLAIAISYIKLNNEKYNLDGNLFLLGFSAGGHLVGSYSYLYKEIGEKIHINFDILKPTGLILSYPVISLTHNVSYLTTKTISNFDESLKEKLSIEKHVTKEYPPTFIWTTLGDRGVNPTHSQDMAKSLKKANIIHELHIISNLDHGSSIVSLENKQKFEPFTEEDLKCKVWVDKAISFIVNTFYKKGE